MPRAATGVILATAFLPLAAAAQQQTLPVKDAPDESGFVSIFDGKSLNGWEGDPRFWRVEGGSLVGEITPGNEVRENTFIVWRGGEAKGVLQDFELKLEYRISERGNSGINYRSRLVEGKPFVLQGLQFDVDGPLRSAGTTRHTANHYEEKGRTFMALRGQVARATDGGERRVIGVLGDYLEMASLIRNDGWNEAHVIARGTTAIHLLNGHVMSVLVDDDERARSREGLLGVQVHVGPPMKVEYRNIRIRRLGPAAPQARQPDQNPYSSASDLELGGRLYRGRCGHCHGLEGEGGRGSVLNGGGFRHGGSDREVFQVIRRGIPNTEMPGAANLPEHEVWRMVAYVQQLARRGAPEQVAGDAAAGARVYQKAGCAACHSIDGQGGHIGQDLSDVGARRAVRHLRDSVVDPDADIPLDYRSVSVTTKAGQRSSGIHLNEDEYSVQLRDLAGELRSFLKSELREVALTRKSLMPPYASLPRGDVDDLVAFLASLRPGARAGSSELWDFDRLDEVGGHRATRIGEPKLVETPAGKAVEFDGVDDALIVDSHPLAGARTFTLEAVFRPDGGAREQRFLHLNEYSATGSDGENRMLLELRVDGAQWFLDSYHQSGAANKALMNREALHAVGAWHHVATVYDGRELRNYVDGVQQAAFAIDLAPQGPGRTALGARLNQVSHFKGAIRRARFTRRALQPSEFLDAGGRR